MTATLTLPLWLIITMVGATLAAIGLFTWWLWRTGDYRPPPTVHRDYRREGDPEEEADKD